MPEGENVVFHIFRSIITLAPRGPRRSTSERLVGRRKVGAYVPECIEFIRKTCSPRQLEYDDKEAMVSWKDDNSSTWAIGGVNNMNSELTEGFDSMDGDWCKIHIACIR